MEYGTPIDLLDATVEPAWIDYNGHMNVAYYLLIFDRAVDELLNLLGIGRAYTESGRGSAFSLEAHMTFQREVGRGDRLRVTAQLLDFDAKRMHFFLSMTHVGDGFLAATCEQIAIHVDMASRKSAPFPDDTTARLGNILGGHKFLGRPAAAGRVIGIKRSGRPDPERPPE